VEKYNVVPSWLSPVERLAVNQSVKGPNPFDGATSQLPNNCRTRHQQLQILEDNVFIEKQ
jgi:hypothetical protein